MTPNQPDAARQRSRPSRLERLSARSAALRGTVAPTVAAFRDPTRLAWELWLEALRHDARARLATAGLIALLGIVCTGALLPPVVGHLEQVLGAPSARHPLGTDDVGRDLLLSLLKGGVPTLGGGFGTALTATMLGAALGTLSGFFRGIPDAAVRRATEALQAIPTLLALVVVQALHPMTGTWAVPLVVAAARWPEIAIVVRADVLRAGRLDHVTAALALGASPGRILARHLLPAVVSSALILTTFGTGAVVGLETAAAVLGIGYVDPITWGALLAQARAHPGAWWLVAFPTLFLALTLGAALLLGEAMRDALDPRLHDAHIGRLDGRTSAPRR